MYKPNLGKKMAPSSQNDEREDIEWECEELEPATLGLQCQLLSLLNEDTLDRVLQEVADSGLALGMARLSCCCHALHSALALLSAVS